MTPRETETRRRERYRHLITAGLWIIGVPVVLFTAVELPWSSHTSSSAASTPAQMSETTQVPVHWDAFSPDVTHVSMVTSNRSMPVGTDRAVRAGEYTFCWAYPVGMKLRFARRGDQFVFWSESGPFELRYRLMKDTRCPDVLS